MLFFIGGWGNEANREVVFRVRVVRDVRAKLCASYPGGVAIAPDACPAAAPAPSVAVLVSRGVPAGVPVVSRLFSFWFRLWCPGCPG